MAVVFAVVRLYFIIIILICFDNGERGLGLNNEDKAKLYFEDHHSQNQGYVWERDIRHSCLDAVLLLF